jgi:hypothetical protein
VLDAEVMDDPVAGSFLAMFACASSSIPAGLSMIDSGHVVGIKGNSWCTGIANERIGRKKA